MFDIQNSLNNYKKEYTKRNLNQGILFSALALLYIFSITIIENLLKNHIGNFVFLIGFFLILIFLKVFNNFSKDIDKEFYIVTEFDVSNLSSTHDDLIKLIECNKFYKVCDNEKFKKLYFDFLNNINLTINKGYDFNLDLSKEFIMFNQFRLNFKKIEKHLSILSTYENDIMEIRNGLNNKDLFKNGFNLKLNEMEKMIKDARVSIENMEICSNNQFNKACKQINLKLKNI